MSYKSITLTLLSSFAFIACAKTIVATPAAKSLDLSAAQVELFVTSETEKPLFEPVAMTYSDKAEEGTMPIYINSAVQFQTMDGFGAAITGSACYNLLKMKAEDRQALLKETFDAKTGVGYSFIRVSIGCSDFSLEDYTWCDTPGLENFAIHHEDRDYVFPVLKEILAINPKLKIMGSPWSPPRWMKVNNLTDRQPFNSWTSGQLNPDHYPTYAQYLLKWIQTMEKEGFPIYAITLQNEPLNRGNSASMFMTWQEQRDFIKSAVGPIFKAANNTTKIIAYDHNYDYDVAKAECADQIDYPARIYEDKEAAQYIDGSAWHAYGGDKQELLDIHTKNPEKNIYFTEMSIGLWGDGYTFKNDFMWNMREVCLGTINYFNKAVIMWNFMLDTNHGPYRPGGCDICLGCIDIDPKDYKTMRKNSHYYTMAHLSKVIRPDAKRIEVKSTTIPGIYYIAVKNPDNSIGMVLQNDNTTERKVTLIENNRFINYTIGAKTVASFRWGK